MSRLADLERFYALIDRLCSRLGGTRMLTDLQNLSRLAGSGSLFFLRTRGSSSRKRRGPSNCASWHARSCDHIFPSATALAVTCDHISPERRHRRRGCNHISFATCATPGAEVRSRRRNVAQSVLPSVRPVRYPLRRVRGLLGSQGRGRWERSAVRVDAPPSLRSVRLPIAEKLKEPQRTPNGAAPRPFGA